LLSLPGLLQLLRQQ